LTCNVDTLPSSRHHAFLYYRNVKTPIHDFVREETMETKGISSRIEVAGGCDGHIEAEEKNDGTLK
jgi:hypothetical protein